MTAPSVVDLSAPLPQRGLHLIEASAGTGKTYTLETLVARYVAETDLPIARLLLVTFTNDAAAELRQRVRRRLHTLSRIADRGTVPANHEPIEQHIVALPNQPLVQQRLLAALRDFDQATITTIHAFAQQLLTQAGLDHNPTIRLRTDVGTVAVDVVADELARRSLALLETETDGYVPKLNAVLNGLKLARNRPGIAILPNHAEQRRLQAMDQLRQLWEQGPTPDQAEFDAFPTKPFKPKTLKRLIAAHQELGEQLELADAVRTTSRQLSDELLRRNEIGFTELLTEANALVQRSPRAAQEIRSRYRLVLVDEFQDTDPVQWELLSTLFTDRPSRAERALLANRSVTSEHAAVADAAADSSSSTVSESSDSFEALRLFDVDTLETDAGTSEHSFDPEEPPVPVTDTRAKNAREPEAVPLVAHNHITVLVGDPKQAIYGFRGGDLDTYRTAGRQAGDNRATLQRNFRSQATLIDGLNEVFRDVEFGPDVGYVPVDAHNPAVDLNGPAIQVRTWNSDNKDPVEVRRTMLSSDLADLVVELHNDPKHPVDYGNIAVLYTAHINGPPILRALQERGVPAVITRGETVFNTPAVSWWRRLLWALERPTDPARARNAMVAPIIGLHPDDLRDDDKVRRAQGDLRTLSGLLETDGVATALRRLLRDWKAAARLLERPGGERYLVDIEHVGELLHLETRGQPVSATALRELLEELELADPDDANYAAELTRRRLDTEADDNVVRIMSIHTAKGLEFDVVLCPTLFDKPANTSPVHYHPDEDECTEYGLTPGAPALRFTRANLDRAIWDQSGIDLIAERKRLAYVALTRACDRLVVWWPDKKPAKTAGSGLHELLVERGRTLGLANSGDPMAVLRALEAEFPDAIGVHTIAGETSKPVHQAAAPAAANSGAPLGQARRFSRHIDRSANRLSFTGITRVAFPYEDRHGSHEVTPDPDVSDDAGSLDENPDEILDEPLELTGDEVLLAALPAGREPGTRLHGVYELADFGGSDEDRNRQVTQLVVEGFTDLDLGIQERVIEGVIQTFDAPLGPDLGDLRLADLARPDRLDEMHFDLPLKSGADQASTLVALGDLVLSHTDPKAKHGEIITQWGRQLREPQRVVHLGGFLTGSIDLLFRYRPNPDADHRYVVADYKSNKVARWPQPMLPEVYAEPHLATEMLDGQYLLQALLYLLATHRFLDTRLPGYDPDTHLGPASYLFVRGMTGAADAAGNPHGVFTWRPSTALLLAADELLFAPTEVSVT